MASNTPRQRQYRAALDAQQHNLQPGQFTLLLTPEVVLPPGQAHTALPLASRAGRWATVLTFTWPNLLGTTLAPVAPVAGVMFDLPVRRPVWRAALFNDTDTSANLTTLLNEGANVPPDGRQLLPDPVRPRLGVRGLMDPPNLLETTLAPPPPALPVARGWGEALLTRRPALRADAGIANLLGTTLAAAAAGTGVVDLWADLREGDIIRIISPYTAPGGESPLVRILSRRWADGEPYPELTLQFIDPIDASTRLSLLGELGTMAAPPPPANTETDQTAIVTEATNQVRELQMRVAAVEDASTRGDLSFSGAALYVNSAGNIIARRPDGTEATII